MAERAREAPPVSPVDASLPPFNVSAAAADNTAGLINALADAVSTGARLLLPPGVLNFDQDLVLPKGASGPFSIRGMGGAVTRLAPQGGCNGFNFDLSAGTPANNLADIADLGFVATAAAGFPIKLSYGAAGIPSDGTMPGSSIRDVSIFGGGWTSGIVLQECWNMKVRGIYAYGSSASYTKASAVGKGDGGPGSGVALTIAGGVNNRISDLEFHYWSQGIVLNNDGRGAAGDPQGIFIDDVQMVECLEGLHAYGTAGGSLGTLFLTKWMVDNGNIDVANHRCLVLENVISAMIAIGQGLQNGGDSAIILNGCTDCEIAMINLKARYNTTGPAILLTGATSGCQVSGKFITGTIQLDATTSGNVVDVPGAAVVDNGTGNTVGAAPSRLLNVSTRGTVGTGANILIAGFSIAGSAPAAVLVRATGPSLSLFGVPGVVPDPKLQIMSGSTVLASNTGWGGSAQIAAAAAKVGAFAWPAASLDSAILITLQPGTYTAEMSGASGDTGDGLIEVYDAT